MINTRHTQIKKAYIDFINQKTFPCIGAKAAVAKSQVQLLVVGNMACPADDSRILNFIYDFVESYRMAGNIFYSAAVIFSNPESMTEEVFEALLWQRLQSLSDLDAENFPYDSRVSASTASADFSFSLKEEAFFILGLHPGSSRPSRRFAYPALIFNPHAQFEEMKETNKYDMMKKAVRKKELIFSGSINPMLNDHGRLSETNQYSGKHYKSPLECPLKINHANK